MATRIFSRTEWDALVIPDLPKKVKEWNRRKGYMVQKTEILQSFAGMYETPGEQRRRKRRQSRYLGGKLEYAERLRTYEYPSKLPYVFGYQDKKLNKDHVYVDEDFLKLIGL